MNIISIFYGRGFWTERRGTGWNIVDSVCLLLIYEEGKGGILKEKPTHSGFLSFVPKIEQIGTGWNVF